MSERDLADHLAAAARELQAENDVDNTLEKAIGLCVELVECCDDAGVSIVHRRGIDTPAATSDRVERADDLQYELNEGPCLDAIRVTELIHSSDLAIDGRWPKWGPRVVDECDVRSMLSVRLYVEEDNLGALNMYSRRLDGFDANQQAEGLALAAHVAIALVAAQEIEQLNNAVSARTVIGQAQGILMERFDIDADRAFSVLRRVSQHQNVRLHRVAADVVETRRIPGA
jgi:transcriptional regulator with GAF, ATPase, and Fis domain